MPSAVRYSWISERHLRKHLNSLPFIEITGVVSVFQIFFYILHLLYFFSLYFLTFVRLQCSSHDLNILCYGSSFVLVPSHLYSGVFCFKSESSADQSVPILFGVLPVDCRERSILSKDGCAWSVVLSGFPYGEGK